MDSRSRTLERQAASHRRGGSDRGHRGEQLRSDLIFDPVYHPCPLARTERRIMPRRAETASWSWLVDSALHRLSTSRSQLKSQSVPHIQARRLRPWTHTHPVRHRGASCHASQDSQDQPKREAHKNHDQQAGDSTSRLAPALAGRCRGLARRPGWLALFGVPVPAPAICRTIRQSGAQLAAVA